MCQKQMVLEHLGRPGVSLSRSYFAINEPGFGGFEWWVGWTVAMLIWTA
jgi:hypothetical protein